MCFEKKYTWRESIFTSTRFLPSVSSASYIEIKLAIHHVLSISQKTEFHPFDQSIYSCLTSIVSTDLEVEPLHIFKNDCVPLVRILTPFH